jgi:hypothetical protein
LWCLRADGTLAGCTYDPKQKVIGWHRTITSGKIISIAAIPSSYGDTNGRTELWASVQRSLGSGQITTIELLADYEGAVLPQNYCPLDCAITQTFAKPTSVITGLDILDNMGVWAWADGSPYGPLIVKNGQVTLPDAVTTAIVGIPMPNPVLYSNDLEGGAMNGTSQTRARDIAKASLRVRNTYVPGLAVGLDADNKTQLAGFMLDSQSIDEPSPLYTGDIDMDDIGWPAGNERKATFYVEQTLPAPACVCLAVLPLSVGD